MKKKLISIIAMSMVAVMTLSACGGDTTETTTGGEETTSAVDETSGANATVDLAARGGKILYLNNNSEPGTFNPQLAQGTHDSWVLDHCFTGLYRKSPEGGVEPGVAESATTSEDGIVWTFKLKDTLWSNGEPVTAHDFVSAWLFCLDPANASNYASQLYYIKGAEEINTAETPEAVTAAMANFGAVALDDKTLEVTLVNAVPYFTDLVTHYTYYPTHKATIEANPQWANTPETFVSNGPFVLTKWEHKSTIEIRKNENFYEKDRVKLDGINFAIIEQESSSFQAYDAGQLDYIYPVPTDIIEKYNSEGNPELTIGADLSVYYYMLNTTAPGLNNVKVRQALAMSVNRQDLVNYVTKGGQTPAYSLSPVGLTDGHGDYVANLGPLFGEDFAAAKAMLEEGLAEEGLTMAEFKPVLLYNTNDLHKSVAEAIQAMWKSNLGLDVTLENQEFQVVLDNRAALNYDIVRAGWVGDFADPMTFVDLFTSWNSLNQTGWASDEYDALVKKAMSTMDNDTRMDAMKDAERILMRDMPVIPVYFYTQPSLKKPYVEGNYKPINRYMQFQWADLVTE